MQGARQARDENEWSLMEEKQVQVILGDLRGSEETARQFEPMNPDIFSGKMWSNMNIMLPNMQIYTMGEEKYESTHWKGMDQWIYR